MCAHFNLVIIHHLLWVVQGVNDISVFLGINNMLYLHEVITSDDNSILNTNFKVSLTEVEKYTQCNCFSQLW